ncbi:MAG: fumarate hydratase class II, partial [Bacillariaceae sp.]
MNIRTNSCNMTSIITSMLVLVYVLQRYIGYLQAQRIARVFNFTSSWQTTAAT